MNELVAEASALPIARSSAIQMRGDRLDPERAPPVAAVQMQLVDLADDL